MAKLKYQEEEYVFEGEFVMLHKTSYQRDYIKRLINFVMHLMQNNKIAYSKAAQS